MSHLTASHRVRRLAFAVRGVGDVQSALAWRRALNEGIDGAWRAGLDDALDAAATGAQLGSRTWRLPRLQLRLRARDPEALAAALRAALDEALTQQVSPAAPVLQSAEERAAMAFEAYLATGRVPWHDDEVDVVAVARTLRAAAHEALDKALTAAAWPAFWVARASEGAASPVLQRWGALLDEAALERLRSASAAISSQAVGAAVSSGVPQPGEAARCLWHVWQHGTAPIPNAEVKPSAPTPEGAHARLGATEAPPPGLPAAREDPTAKALAPSVAIRGEAAAVDDHAAPATWWAHDAGLVLLHPYLPTLLRAVGCAVDDALVPAQLPRAAALLHALATGRDEAFEFELTLAKLLLGLAPDAPLPPRPLAIDAAARAECDALLGAAIGHWPALGGTGIDSFRQSFLARDGALSRRDDGWHLRVADEPFDVLLGRLPWGIGLVRLPWMEVPLHVHWGAWGA